MCVCAKHESGYQSVRSSLSTWFLRLMTEGKVDGLYTTMGPWLVRWVQSAVLSGLRLGTRIFFHAWLEFAVFYIFVIVGMRRHTIVTFSFAFTDYS